MYEKLGPFDYSPLPSNFFKTKRSVSALYFDKVGDFCAGENIGGEADGRGAGICKEGNLFEGFWSKGLLNGKGRIIYSNGAYYEGEFRNGDFNGNGSYTY